LPTPVFVRLADHDPAVLGVGPLDRFDVRRRGQEVDDGVQHRLDSPVAERGAAEDGYQVAAHGAAAERRHQLVVGDRLTLVLEVLLHDPVVEVGGRLDQVVAVPRDDLPELLRDFAGLLGGAEVVGVGDGPEVDQVDHALEGVLGPDRDLDRHRASPEPGLDRVEGHEEVGPHPVHLVDEGDPGHAIAIGLAPDGLRLGLDPGDGVEHGDGAVEHTKAALDLHREINVSGRVYDVDHVVAPHRIGRGRGDRDPPLTLLLHPVGRRRPLVDLAHLVDAARVEEDPLGGRGLTGIDVRHDADVPQPLERDLTVAGLHRHC